MTSEENAAAWPITMTEASHIARMPSWRGTDAEIAREYGVPEGLIQQIRREQSYNGVNLR
jgi:phage portal protein BeeE